jgi:hypothetical protein
LIVNKKYIQKYLKVKRRKSQDSAAPLPGIFSEPVTESNFDPQSDVSANTPQIWTTTNTVYLSFPDKKTKKNDALDWACAFVLWDSTNGETVDRSLSPAKKLELY